MTDKKKSWEDDYFYFVTPADLGPGSKLRTGEREDFRAKTGGPRQGRFLFTFSAIHLFTTVSKPDLVICYS
jgi:hypothetical protein